MASVELVECDARFEGDGGVWVEVRGRLPAEACALLRRSGGFWFTIHSFQDEDVLNLVFAKDEDLAFNYTVLVGSGIVALAELWGLMSKVASVGADMLVQRYGAEKVAEMIMGLLRGGERGEVQGPGGEDR